MLTALKGARDQGVEGQENPMDTRGFSMYAKLIQTTSLNQFSLSPFQVGFSQLFDPSPLIPELSTLTSDPCYPVHQTVALLIAAALQLSSGE